MSASLPPFEELINTVQECDDDSVWKFPTDIPTRRRLFVPDVFSHPAKLHLGLLQKLIDLYTSPGETLLDPMAGTGSLMLAATQQRNVILRDIQPEYVDMIWQSVPMIQRAAGMFGGLIDIGQADAKELDCPPFNHLIFSPPYGFQSGGGVSNPQRIAALYDGKLGRRWKRYVEQPNRASFCVNFHYVGGAGNSGNKSGRNYWSDMRAIYTRLINLTPTGGAGDCCSQKPLQTQQAN